MTVELLRAALARTEGARKEGADSKRRKEVGAVQPCCWAWFVPRLRMSQGLTGFILGPNAGLAAGPWIHGERMERRLRW